MAVIIIMAHEITEKLRANVLELDSFSKGSDFRNLRLARRGGENSAFSSEFDSYSSLPAIK